MPFVIYSGSMKPNVIVALLVGLVLGFALGQAVKGMPGASGARGASGSGAPAAAGGPIDESTLAIKSGQMPAGTFTDMTDLQKASVMKVMNEHDCDCGCGKGTLAQCIISDPGCPNSPAKLRQLVSLAKQGKTYEQMTAEVFGAGAKPPPPRPQRPPEDTTTVFKVPLEDSPVLGKATAPITIVEFSDYQCPFCTRGHDTIQQLRKEYGDKIRVVMKQNPLDNIHPQARGAAKAAMAAGLQGKYWELHDEMFEHQRQGLDEASLERYATEVGLDIPRWKKDMKDKDSRWEQVIARDQALAAQLQASSTPQFFINGRHISGAKDISIFKAIIEEELVKVADLVKSGVKPDQVYAKLMETAVSSPPAQPAAAPDAPPPSATKKVTVPDDVPYTGPKHAKVTIVEWSDFECPFCVRAVPGLHEALKAYPKDVKFVFRQFPLTSMHPNAQAAAEASLAAHEQGKFWPMHDRMFLEQPNKLTRADLEAHAQAIGLNMGRFRAALETGKFKDKVAADIAAGSAVGVNGTPTFFINGQEHVGGMSADQWKARIEQEIAKANKLLEQGVKLENLYEKMLESSGAPAAALAPAAPPAREIAVGSAPVKGPKNAPVTIVEYSDFQCPFCSQAVPVLKRLGDEYGDKVRVAFKHLPLEQLHPQAKQAAEASMAANEQGKFWEYHDKLFANQRALDRASLEKYAEEVGLDAQRFKQALDSGKFRPAVEADTAEAFKVGANGTPTFYVNGQQVVGADYNRLKSLIDGELSKKK
jgi:protein-disulfide isomerase